MTGFEMVITWVALPQLTENINFNYTHKKSI